MQLQARALLIVAAVALSCCSRPSNRTPATVAGTRPFVQPPAFTQGGSPSPSAGETPSPACTPLPQVVSGHDVDLTLTIAYTNTTIYDPNTGQSDPVRLRMYGGCLASPTIVAEPGDTLRISIANMLPADRPHCVETLPAFGLGCYNTTNFHSHGLHVSPSGNSDNVLLSMHPKRIFATEIVIPGDHPAGTFWYHSHQHGATAMQVSSGMAGALIIKGTRKLADVKQNGTADIDTILHDAGKTPFPEKVFMFSQVAYACFKDDSYLVLLTKNGSWYCPHNDPAYPHATPGVVENFLLQLASPTSWSSSGRFTTVNGVVQPTLTATAGTFERWRLIHGGIRDTIQVSVVKSTTPDIGAAKLSLPANAGAAQQPAVDQTCSGAVVPQYEIAVDGLTRRRIQEIGPPASAAPSANPANPVTNTLQPGYRSDVLIMFPSAGTYCILDDHVPGVATLSRRTGVPRPRKLLGIVEVTGDKSVTPTLRYVGEQLASANDDLPDDVKTGLQGGDIRPWTPFPGDLGGVPPVPCSLPARWQMRPQPQTNASKCVAFEIPIPLVLTVNKLPYDPNRVDFQGTLGSVDEYHVLAGPRSDHVFHIHVNPFQIADVRAKNPATNAVESIYDASGACKPWADNQYCGQKDIYRDSLMVLEGYELFLRTKYVRYVGEYVLHCHILDHEDSGMMSNVAIVPPGGTMTHMSAPAISTSHSLR